MNPVRVIVPKRHGDDRGWFAETFRARDYSDIFVQDNHSLSRPVGTLRGLHFQLPPHAQVKLVRCLKGSIYDVAVDVRKGSPTYGKWVGATLSADNGAQLYIPIGFAHGFVTLEPDTEIAYKVTDYYAPAQDSGFQWDDPQVGVAWPLNGHAPLLSGKDKTLPPLKDFDSPFAYDGNPLLPLETKP